MLGSPLTMNRVTNKRVLVLVYLFSLLLQNMGFPSSISEVAIREYKTVQAAVDAILAGNGKQCMPLQ